MVSCGSLNKFATLDARSDLPIWCSFEREVLGGRLWHPACQSLRLSMSCST